MPVVAVKTTTEPRPSVLITTEDRETSAYDHVIMACHSDMSLKLLEHGGHVTSAEKEVLSGVSWSRNQAVLHSDTAVRILHSLRFSVIEDQLTADAPSKNCLVLLELLDILRVRRWEGESQCQPGCIVSAKVDSG